jgi:plasmid maintenance system killer protein
VKIRNFVHKGLKRLYSEDSVKGVPPDIVDKLRKMFAYLDNMEDPEEWRKLVAWKAHTLSGDRQRHMEPERHPQPPSDVPYRRRRQRNLRCEFRGLPLAQE